MFSNPSKVVPSGALDVSARFMVPAQVLFEALTDTNTAQYYTQSRCKIDKVPGGDYILFDGCIQGQIIVANTKRLELKWRRREWEDNVYSTVNIDFIQLEDAVTELHLHQMNIPKTDKYGNVGIIESVKGGWIDQIFRRISMVLGYSFKLEEDFD